MTIKNYKVFLADPTLDTHSLDVPVIPLGAGLVASYLKRHLPQIEVHVFKAMTPLLQAIKAENPDIMGLSNYMWNTNLCGKVAEYAREVRDDMLIVFGGPEIDSKPYEIESFKRKYSVVDLFVQHEGEVAFLEIIKNYIACERDTAKLIDSIETLGNCFYLNDNGAIISSPKLPRIKNMDEVPSPYLMGLFDKFLAEGTYLPMIQTNRGCPFSCTFCQEGVRYFTKVNSHSLEFVTQELDYIAERVNPSAGLFITDSNWAMYKEDIEISKHIAKIQAQINWPKEIFSSTGKANLKRIIGIGKILNGAMFISNSVQTMSSDVLNTIKRKNLKSSELEENKADLAVMRQEPEVIVPLPKETKESFLSGLEQLFDIGTPQRFAVFQTLILSNSELGEGKTIQEYDFSIKYKQHSSFMGYANTQFVCETERVVVSTSTMSIEELSDCFVYSMLLDALLRFEPVPEIFYFLDSKNVKRSKLTRYMLNSVKTAPTGVSSCIEEFKRSFLDEMFDSEEEVIQHMEKYYKDYKSGLRGGGNLKYSNQLWIDYFDSMMEWLLSCLSTVIDDSKETEEEILALKDYLLTAYIDRQEGGAEKPSTVKKDFNFDIQAWLETRGTKSLQDFQGITTYNFSQTELSGADKTTIWKSLGFQREQGEKYTAVQETRLYLIRMRREIENLSSAGLNSSLYNRDNFQNELVGKLPLKN